MSPIKTHVEVLENVPTDNLSEVVASFEGEGAKVRVIPQIDGQHRLEAIFIDPESTASERTANSIQVLRK